MCIRASVIVHSFMPKFELYGGGYPIEYILTLSPRYSGNRPVSDQILARQHALSWNLLLLRTRQADRTHENILRTIASEVAYGNHIMKLIVGPVLGMASKSVIASVLIVIRPLDEHGETDP
ncbi:hypothetical protein K503DRAFT_153291 [Rhizopogon vinicolor AM-OR11-026]|uniref:Uncharacterized protein n=1 Tax=Rhizopogon vinicolor AM-OR11-026 TaxID=1314800 RepID=A0A1B7N100_9AGAM|nr:hypothetical protein K503DRAFT_153291 [Rhizopogon vinicolor AM-OR11-026]